MCESRSPQGEGEILLRSARDRSRRGAVLLLALAVLSAAAILRSAEYDEQYTLFLTAGTARPVWPDQTTAGAVRLVQDDHGGFTQIAHDLRATDVHPPLYFWLAWAWRAWTGPSLLSVRLLSVLCGLGALMFVGGIAHRAGAPPALAMLLTLGCYGFAYTSAIARGFALAGLLTLAGTWVLLVPTGRRGWRGLLGGTLLGAATAANYLASFIGLAVLTWATCARAGAVARLRPALPPMVGFGLWLPLDLWFFLAQRGSRTDQFPPFHLADALSRLATYAGANLLGGLPLYAPEGTRQAVGAALAGLLVLLCALVALSWKRIGAAPYRGLLAFAAAAPACGLLLLGLAFNNTPIELRYLASAAPFASVLLAGALAALRPRWRRALSALVVACQAAAIAGLLLRPETMQPARAVASSAARLAAGGLVLVPRGNDGVGIVGAFALHAPADLRLLLVSPEEPVASLRQRIAGERRVVLALIAQDASSRTALPIMRAALAAPCWQPAGVGSNVIAYQRICEGE